MSLRFFSSFINNKPKKYCVNCVHYVKYKYTYIYDELYVPETNLGNCSIFGGKQHVVTKELEYDNALSCRTNEHKCGKDGRYYLKYDKK
jgi:hypothetical protein